MKINLRFIYSHFIWFQFYGIIKLKIVNFCVEVDLRKRSEFILPSNFDLVVVKVFLIKQMQKLNSV